MKARSAGGEPVGGKPENRDGEGGKHDAEGEALGARSCRPAGIGRLRVRRIKRVDVGVVPHVERAGGAGAGGDREKRDDGRQPG